MDTNTNEKITPQLLMRVGATALMSFCGVVSETAMNVTFPTLMREFSVNTSAVQWLTTGYLLVLALVIPLSSFFKKRFWARHLFFTASGVFILGTLVCIFAPYFSVLLLGRILQGIGTGIALPLMFNIILTQSPLSKIGLMMGIASLICAMAPAVGPVLGGFVVEAYGWRMIFAVLLPILLISLWLGFKSIGAIANTEKATFDIVGYGFLAVGFIAFVYATEQSAENGWFSTKVLVFLVISVVGLWAFVRRSRSVNSPLVNLKVFKNQSFTLALLFILIAQFNVLALGYLIPNYAQLVSHSSTSVAGMLLLPGCLVGAAIAPISGRLYDKLGAKIPILIGGILLIFATGLFVVFSENLTTALFMGIYVIFTLGQGLSVGNSMTFGLSQLAENQSADGNAVINTLQQLSGAVGTSVVASLVASAQATQGISTEKGTLLGSSHSFVLLEFLAILAMIFIVIGLRKKN